MGFVQSTSWNLNIWDVFRTNQVQMEQCSRKVTGTIRSLVNVRDLQLGCANLA